MSKREHHHKYATAAARWAGVGPYYAMFPSVFSDAVVKRYTREGEMVLDPFAGRGTAVFSAAAHGRRGIGVEINPVGWIYAQAKLNPALQDAVASRFRDMSRAAYRYRKAALEMSPFFHWCYHPDVLQFLLAGRAQLDWRNRRVDRTAMAILLVNLHGKRENSLSNQMRQTKSMSPDYAVSWWRERSLKPPELDPMQFLLARLMWRYAKGIPETEGSRVYLGDSLNVLPRIPSYLSQRESSARLLLTSPPYYGITNYYYDQWLRLWMLGGMPAAKRSGGRFKGKFENKQVYCELLLEVFRSSARLLRPDATIYVRADRRKLTRRATRKVLKKVFPDHHLRCLARPYTRPTQTKLFGQSEPKLGEVDLVLTR